MNPTAARLRLIAITDFESVSEEETLARWQRLAVSAAPGTVALDLRDRRLPARRLLETGAELRAVARAAGQLFVVNDRLDLALLLDADGVHLGEHGVASTDARGLVPDTLVIRACHAVDAVAGQGADVVLLSPILEPRKGNAALGLGALGVARRALDADGSATRLFALGGVDAARAPACLEAGADGVAAIGAALGARDAAPLVAALGIRR